MSEKKDINYQAMLNEIQRNIEEMRPSEKKVANYIINNIDDVLYSNIAKLSKEIGVSEPTIIRFCRSLGYTGFQEFKIELAKTHTHQNGQLTLINEDIMRNDSLQDIAKKVINSHLLTLSKTLMSLDMEQLEMVGDELINAKKIEMYGLGGSGTVAIDCENKFIRTKLNTYVCIDAHVQLMRASLLESSSVVIIFSNMGATKHLLTVCKIAKQNNAKIVVITSKKNSPLSKYADHVIFVYSSETKYRSEPSSARLGMMSIMDILVTYIAFKNYDEYADNVYKARQALEGEKLNY